MIDGSGSVRSNKGHCLDSTSNQKIPFLARRNYYYEMRHMLLWAAVAAMLEGSLAAVVVAKTFNASELLINIAATTPLAAYMTSLFWGLVCVGRRKVRIFTLCASGAVTLLALGGMVPLTAGGTVAFIVLMGVAQFFLTGVVTVRSALWKSNYPQKHRGRIVARLQIARSMVYLLVVALIARVFDHNPDYYRWVYPIFALLGVCSLWFIGKTHVRGEDAELARRAEPDSVAENLVKPVSLLDAVSPGAIFKNAFRILRVDETFRKYCIAQMYTGCGNLILRTVVIVILTNHLLANMSAVYWISVVLLEALPMLVRLGTMPRFAAYYDRVGVVRFRVINGTCWLITNILGACGAAVVFFSDSIGANYVVWAVILFACLAIGRGVCAGGGAIAWNLGHLHFAKSDDAEMYMGIHVSLTGLRGLIMPFVGIVIWNGFGLGVFLVSITLSMIALRKFWIMDREERLVAAKDERDDS